MSAKFVEVEDLSLNLSLKQISVRNLTEMTDQEGWQLEGTVFTEGQESDMRQIVSQLSNVLREREREERERERERERGEVGCGRCLCLQK